MQQKTVTNTYSILVPRVNETNNKKSIKKVTKRSYLALQSLVGVTKYNTYQGNQRITPTFDISPIMDRVDSPQIGDNPVNSKKSDWYRSGD